MHDVAADGGAGGGVGSTDMYDFREGISDADNVLDSSNHHKPAVYGPDNTEVFPEELSQAESELFLKIYFLFKSKSVNIGKPK